MFTKTALSLTRKTTRPTQFRFLVEASAASAKQKIATDENKMQAWQIHSYDGLDGLRLSNVRIPVILRPSEVLIKVEASSVNPIDIAMANGYGATLLGHMRKTRSLVSFTDDQEIELPLTLGRDFSGVIVSKGYAVRDKLDLGDQVWGVIPVDQQGCHAQYAVVDSDLVNIRPSNLSHIEAAGVLYAGLTAWSALWLTGSLYYKTILATKANQRILVLGGSGGVGTLAIQLLKAWNMNVVTTCSTDAVEMIEKLGADVIVDYKENGADSQIISNGPYEIILDCCNQGPDLVKKYPHKTYITLNSPMLKNVDQYGLIGGMARNCGYLLKYNVLDRKMEGCVKWAFFTPSRTGLCTLQELVERGQVLPIIHKVYTFEELPAAYARMSEGHLRGKIIIDMT